MQAFYQQLRKPMPGSRELLWMLFLVFLVSCSPNENNVVSQIEGDEPSTAQSGNLQTETTEWPTHGQNQWEQRYSTLAQINTNNVSELNLAWFVDLPTKRGQEATPLVIDAVIYTTSAWSHVMALDASTGELIWHFDPMVPKSYGIKACCDAVNRGVAVMGDRVFVGTLDGRLIALDKQTGKQLWSTITVNQQKNYTITGAPRAMHGKVFIGNGGAEFGVRGYISAYDAETGRLVWRFYTVPGGQGDPIGTEPVESQTATWNGEWWKFGGGGTVWDSMTIDSEANLLYFGVGNGSPWNPNIRSAGKGDNWFLASIVAVDLDTGAYRWHYQTTPGEGWDFTATQHMILADLEIDGAQRKVLMQAPKNGFFYVLDRINGELISAEPFVAVNWASHIDPKTSRPVVVPEAEYWKTGEPALVSPSWMGGHNWHPMSFDPQTGLVYLPAQETAFPYLAENEQTPSRLAVNLGVDTTAAALPDDPAVIKQVKEATSGRLIAWDPVAQKEAWRVEHPGVWNGGVLSTAGGLVFHGSATGFFAAYRSTTGEKLWEYPAQTGIVAPPISYEVAGEQYVAVSAGWGGIFPLMAGVLVKDATITDPVNRSRLLVFKLGGRAALPENQEQMNNMVDLSSVELDSQLVTRGFKIYDRYCAVCHGAGTIGGGVVADLRYSKLLTTPDRWKKVVIDGVFSKRGMVAFGSELSAKDAEAVRQYVVSRNQFAHQVGDTRRLGRR